MTSKKVVVTGCFQLLHEGHLNLLQRAKALGQVIVLLNTDEGVLSLKKYLAEPFPTRKRNLLETNLVDVVFPFETDPTRLLSAIRPDVLLMGSDHTAEEAMSKGGEFVGEIVIAPYTKGVSSRRLYKQSLVEGKDVPERTVNTKLVLRTGRDNRQQIRLGLSSVAARNTLSRITKLDPALLNFYFWKKESGNSFLYTFPFRKLDYKNSPISYLSEKQIVRLKKDKQLRKRVPWDWLVILASEKKRQKDLRAKSIETAENSLTELHKLFLRDSRYEKKASFHPDTQKSGIIPHMDGSVLLWLSVILSAKRDFLIGIDDPRRAEHWELMDLRETLDENWNVIKGTEDAYSYLSAKAFLFDDTYRISFDNPNDPTFSGKTITCRELLDVITSTSDGAIINPDIEHLRSSVAKLSGDPILIEEFGIPEPKEK